MGDKPPRSRKTPGEISDPAPAPPYSLPNTDSAWIQSGLSGLREDVRDLSTRIESRIDTLDEKLERRFNTLDEKLSGRIDTLDERIRQVEKKVSQWGGGLIAVNALLIITAILLRVFNVSITIGD